MFSTKSVKSLKNLFAGYHEPTQLSKQQSQKLLDGLKLSFRKQLDREYGESSDVSARATADHQAELQTRHSAASQHLKSILSNPLFSYNRQQIAPIPQPVMTPARDPMDVFDHAVAKGLMNLQAATGCMMAKWKLMEASASTSEQDAEIAQRVVRWLRNSGKERNMEFLDNGGFVRALVPYMIAEGMESLAWEWMTKTMQGSPENLRDRQRALRASLLLSSIVRAKTQPAYGDLNAGITAILDAEQLFSQNPLLPEFLVQPWRSVSWLSTVDSFSKTAPSEKLFDAHVATADRLARRVPIERAHLHLHHPTHPDSAPALRILSDRQRIRQMLQKMTPESLNAATSKAMSIGPWIAALGQDTVNHLAQSGRLKEAQGIADFLQAELLSLANPTLRTAS